MTENALQEAHVVVRGRVQGVNFRWMTSEQARGAGVGGWVRNRQDGTVEAVVQGAPDQVARVVDWMRHGPPGARVESIDVHWTDTSTRAERFEIVR